MDSIHPTTREADARLREATTEAQYAAFMERIAGTNGGAWCKLDDGDLLGICQGRKFIIATNGRLTEVDGFW